LSAIVRIVPSPNGRVPPHDLDAEAAVLSASLLSASALGRALEVLLPEHFYSEAHRRVFEAAVALSEAATPVDMVTVGGWLKDRDRLAQVGGMPYLHEVLGAAPALGPAEVEAYARIVFDKWRLRTLIETCQRVAAEGYTDVGDLEAFLDDAESRVHQATSARGKAKTVQTMRAAAKDAFVKIKTYAENHGAILGTRTGFDRLDRALGGMHAGDLLVFAGRPAMGKTSLVMNIAVNVALQGLGAYVFSVEMPNEQLAMRAICSEARVNLSKARSNAFAPGDWPKLTEATLRLTEPEHLYLDEDSAVTMLDMRSRLREHQRVMEKAGVKLGLVAVDYLQLVRGNPNPENREQEVAAIARGLKAIAKEFKVPVLSLAQLNRAVEARPEKRPKMSDLRDSGAIEQDADVVVMLYRDDYYDKCSKEPGVTELIVTKQRNGPTGTFKVGFEASCTQFYNLPEGEYCE
jgi:replicative DNA helicase